MKYIIKAIALMLIIFVLAGCVASGDKELISKVEKHNPVDANEYEKLEFGKTYLLEDDLEIVIDGVTASFSEDGLLNLEYECTLTNLIDKDNLVQEGLTDGGWILISEEELDTADVPNESTFGTIINILSEEDKRVGYIKPKESVKAVLKAENLIEKKYIEESLKYNDKVFGYYAIKLGDVGCWINLNNDLILNIL